MSALAEPPELPQPGSFASSALDRKLLAMYQDPLNEATESPADFFARRLTARAVDAARSQGLSVHAFISAAARQLVAVAELLPALPTPEELEAELSYLETLPTAEEGGA
ncbi:hypothetical protein PBI_FLOOF_78 [Microbacterium phage Floof]|uniref:Uncharacterized protein n=1 Tax=Microbacterium phage Floof TaxID=2201433 RepID=A0A2Z4Q622_9CAUD|nr:hypothetical protein PBI_FLOOF_78 [Microbacterium phage Floof]